MIDKDKIELLKAMLSGDYDPPEPNKIYNEALSNDLHKDGNKVNREENNTLQEQLQHFEQLIDKALLNDKKNLTIIHGKGAGILRKTLHKKLKKLKQINAVKHYEINPKNSGETLVYFK